MLFVGSEHDEMIRLEVEEVRRLSNLGTNNL